MKRLIIFTALLLAACGADSPGITPEMIASMNAFADQFDAWYPEDGQNIARVCAASPTGLYWNKELQSYAVTCPLPWYENSYGVVTLDENQSVLNAFGLAAASQGEITQLLGTLGWESRMR